MTRPIPKQYRRFYTPAQLTGRDNDIAFEKWWKEYKTVEEEKSLSDFS